MAKKAAPKSTTPAPPKKKASVSKSGNAPKAPVPKASPEKNTKVKNATNKATNKASTKPPSKPSASPDPVAMAPPTPKKAKSSEPVAVVGVVPGLGKKFSCYSCGTKFYDLGKPEKRCPKCGADQMTKPAIKSRAAALRSQEFDVEEEPAEEEDFVEDDEIADPVEEAEEEEEEEA